MLHPGDDFSAQLIFPGDSGKGRSREVLKLTLDGAKQFMLQAPTARGRLVRQYFIDAEKDFRRLLEQRRLLNEKVVAGEIEVRHIPSGEVFNPLQDPAYIDHRLAAARGCNQKDVFEPLHGMCLHRPLLLDNVKTSAENGGTRSMSEWLEVCV